MDSRQQFEEWQIGKYCGGEDRLKRCSNADDVYYYQEVQLKWVAWQASRESMVVELPEENPMGSGPGDHGDGRPSFEQHCAAECNFIIRDCRDAIHNAGIRTK